MFFAESRAALRRYLEALLDGAGLSGRCPWCLDQGMQYEFCPCCGRMDLRDEDELQDAAAAEEMDGLIEAEEMEDL